MKRKFLMGIILFIMFSLFMVVSVNAEENKFKLEMNVEENTNAEELVYVLKFNEQVVACNFNIVYDKEVLEFKESLTSGLYAAENDNVISCIYADMAQNGVNEFKLKFNPIKQTSETTIGITNAKFRAKDKETSYEGKDIEGLDNVLKIEITENDNKNLVVKIKNEPSTKISSKVIIGVVVIICLVILFTIIKNVKKN